jgi:hypothetical protein
MDDRMTERVYVVVDGLRQRMRDRERERETDRVYDRKTTMRPRKEVPLNDSVLSPYGYYRPALQYTSP